MPRLWSLSDGTPMVPNVTGVSWWSEFLPPWQTRIVDRPVDTLRTAELPRFENRVRTNAGVPLQFTIPRTSTIVSGGRLHRVGLPERVWVETRTTDENWFGIPQQRVGEPLDYGSPLLRLNGSSTRARARTTRRWCGR